MTPKRPFVLLGMGLSLLAMPPAARAQTAAPSLFDRLVGRWEAKGTIDGKQTVHDVDAELVLNRGYVRLHEVSHEKTKEGAPEYEAIVFISRDTAGNYSMLWLDTTSSAGLTGSGIAHAKPTETTIPFIIEVGKDHVFRNTFVYAAATNTWAWRLDDDVAGTLTPFARLTLTRRR